MRKKFGAAALDIVFGLVVGYLFLDKITGWALNNAFLQSRFSDLVLCLVPEAIAFAVLILYIRLLAEAELKDYYLGGAPKLRWFIVGILSAAIYAGVVLLVLPGDWTVHAGESLVSSVLSAVWRNVKIYLINGAGLPAVIYAGISYGALRRRMSLPAALIGVWALAAVLEHAGFDSAFDIAMWAFLGIWAAALSMIAEYTGSVWSAVLYDAALEILLRGRTLFSFVCSYTPPHPYDVNILFYHQAANPNRALNRLMIGMIVIDSVPIAIIHLLLIAYLYAKIRKREAGSMTGQKSAAA